MKIIVSTDSPSYIRLISGDPSFKSEELYQAPSSGHAFKAGDRCVLHGLVDFPEYNGDEVIVSAIREDGPKGKAYYVKGRIENHCNWVYEYRLKAAAKTKRAVARRARKTLSA